MLADRLLIVSNCYVFSNENKNISDLVTHKLYRSDLGRAVEDNLEKFGSQAQGHKALATDTFYFY